MELQMQNKNSIVKVFTGNLLHDHPDKASIKAVDEALLRGMKRYLFSSSSVAADYAVTSRLHVFFAGGKKWSGRLDSNQRPLRPERSAPTRLSYAPTSGILYEGII